MFLGVILALLQSPPVVYAKTRFRPTNALQLNFFNHPPMPPRRPLRAVSGNIVKRKELTPFLRGKILGWHEVGESVYTISQALGILRRTVRDTIDKKDIHSEGKLKERSS